MMATNLSPSPSVIQRLVNEVYQLPSLFNVVNSYLLWLLVAWSVTAAVSSVALFNVVNSYSNL